MKGWIVCLGAFSCMMTGCASTPARGARVDGDTTAPRAERVMLARAGAEVTIEWRTRPGTIYALVYKERPDPQQPWRPVEGYERIRGTGRTQTITLPSWPGDSRRFTVVSSPEGQAERLPRRRTDR